MTTNPNPRLVQGKPLVSEFAQDPDMHELVVMFVDEMPEKIRAIQGLWDSRDLENLKRLAHQLKGASGGYGFGVLGFAAGKLEETLKAPSTGGTLEGQMSQVQTQVSDLIDLCKRVAK